MQNTTLNSTGSIGCVLTLLVQTAAIFLLPTGVQPAFAEAKEQTTATHPDLHAARQQLNNPLSTLWTLQTQLDITGVNDVPRAGRSDKDGEVRAIGDFQPVLPLHLNRNWNLINRAVVPVALRNVVPNNEGGIDHDTDLGDIVLANIVAPAKSLGFIAGAGVTWMFPTATSDGAGTEKWSAGPTGGAVYVGDKWIGGVFAQQWWSFAGDDDREDVSLMDAQYGLWRLLPGGWQVGTNQDITVDWKAGSGDKVTLPIGFGVGRTLKLGGTPVKIDAQVSWAVVHPDEFGQRWGFRLRVTPIIPALCCTGYLF